MRWWTQPASPPLPTAGVSYVCEIMPVESAVYPDPFQPDAIAAAARTAAELGAHVVKTSMPTPPEAVSLATTCDVPIIIAGGELTSTARDCCGRSRARSGRERQGWRLGGTCGGRRTRPGWCGRCGRQLISQNAGSLANSHS